jgi:hypothetical protein
MTNEDVTPNMEPRTKPLMVNPFSGILEARRRSIAISLNGFLLFGVPTYKEEESAFFCKRKKRIEK